MQNITLNSKGEPLQFEKLNKNEFIFENISQLQLRDCSIFLCERLSCVLKFELKHFFHTNVNLNSKIFRNSTSLPTCQQNLTNRSAMHMSKFQSLCDSTVAGSLADDIQKTILSML